MPSCPRALPASLASALLIGTCALAPFACGGGSPSPEPEQARRVVSQAIRAIDDGDYAKVCDLSSRHLNAVTAKVMGTDNCAAAYEALFGTGARNRYADLVRTIRRYTPRAVEEQPRIERTRVTLDGPHGKIAYSFLVEEDGQFKITDLFVASSLTGGSASAAG